MPSIQVKNVPTDVHAALRRRAGRAGQSLQEFLLAELVRTATEPTVDDVLERIAERSGGRLPLTHAVKDVRADRDRR